MSKQYFDPERRFWLMGFAIVLVVLHHCLCARGSDSLVYSFFGGIFANGNIGVNIFFIVSSYGLCFSLEKNSLKGYIINRAKRIYPVYVSFLLLYFLITSDPEFLDKSLNALTLRSVFPQWGRLSENLD